MTSQNFYNKIPPDEKKTLLSNIAKAPHFFLTVDTPKGLINLQISRRENNGDIVAYSSLPLDFKLLGQYSIHFVYLTNKYETSAKVSNLDDGQYLFKFENEIFRVQRRQNFRALLPDSWVRNIHIHHLDGQMVNIAGLVINLSLKGCLFACKEPHEKFIVGCELDADLQIEDYPVVQVKAIIRRVGKHIEGKSFGLEFMETLGEKDSETLNQITIKADRITSGYTY